MNVLLVCMSGITTRVLANRLQVYGKSLGRTDTFTACCIGRHTDYLENADLVLVAPQARYSIDALKQETDRLNLPVCFLNEEDFVFSRLDKIYHQCETACRTAKPQANKQNLHPLQLMAHALLNALLGCVPVLIFGLLAAAGYALTGWVVLQQAGNALLGMIVLYLMFSLGYHYARSFGGSTVASGLLSLGAPLLMLPTSEIRNSWHFSVHLSTGGIPLKAFALPHAALMLTVSLLVICILDLFRRIGWPNTYNTAISSTATAQITVIFALVLCLRVLLSTFF